MGRWFPKVTLEVCRWHKERQMSHLGERDMSGMTDEGQRTCCLVITCCTLWSLDYGTEPQATWNTNRGCRCDCITPKHVHIIMLMWLLPTITEPLGTNTTHHPPAATGMCTQAHLGIVWITHTHCWIYSPSENPAAFSECWRFLNPPWVHVMVFKCLGFLFSAHTKMITWFLWTDDIWMFHTHKTISKE